MVIYQIRNIQNNKVYIGQTIHKTPRLRWAQHKVKLRHNKHRNRHLQNAWNKYGECSFEFLVIHEATSLEELNRKEAELISAMDSEYNIRPGGDSFTHSEETKKIISEISRKRQSGPIVRETQSKLLKEKFKNDPALRKMISERTKLAMTDEVKDKLAKTYNGFISPDGVIYKNVRNLANFCREHGINRGNMVSVATGNRVAAQGWKRYDGN